MKATFKQLQDTGASEVIFAQRIGGEWKTELALRKGLGNIIYRDNGNGEFLPWVMTHDDVILTGYTWGNASSMARLDRVLSKLVA